MIKFDLVPVWVWMIAVLVLVGAAGAGGWKLRDADYQRHLRADAVAAQKASERARGTEAKNEQTSQEVGREVEEKQAEIRYVTRTILKEVPIYVSPESDARCTVPNGFVRVHDAATTGNPPAPDTPEQPNGEASGIDLSTVAATVVDNYGYARELESQVIGWQNWYSRVAKDWPKK